MSNAARKPVVAGQFYEDDEKKLKKQIESCFLSGLGPGAPSGKKENKIIGAISPHAGYVFSGPAAAHVYKEIAETKIPDVYIILGPSHSGYESCISAKDWETPLGILKSDKALSKILSKIIPVNEEAHISEHSIEVQLPFLQYVNQGKDFTFLPVMVSHDRDYSEIAGAIKLALEKAGKKAIIIASSDFTHYGESYGYTPFTENIKKNMHNLDNEAVGYAKKMDAEGFIEFARQKQATICGALPIAALIRAIDAKKAKLLKYYTSADVMGDYSTAVGYAAVAYYQ